MKKIFLTLSVAFAVLAVSAQTATTKTDAKPAAKTTAAAKPAAKTDAKPAAKPAAKTDAKPAATPAK